MTPLIASIASGNCTVVKPSEYTPNVSNVMENIIKTAFKEEYITMIRGNREVLKEAIEQDFDHIFFTGSTGVGKIIMEQAAKKLIPVTLELGGKSPCIVDKTAKIDIAARRIVWGKLMNAGQNCIAPDYFLVHTDIKQEFIERVIFYIEKFYTSNPKKSKEFGRIITENHVNRIAKLIENAEIIYGGQYDVESKYFQPTILNNVKLTDSVMGEEIFGPIFPIIDFEYIEEVLKTVRAMPKPLALYIFTQSGANAKDVTENLAFGGGCINDVMIHVSNHNMPFGGTGASGIGKYHGKYSIKELSNLKGIVNISTTIDLSAKYPPYSKRKVNVLRSILK
jgi:aldehyde dehydrogenase (NAD+)